MKKWTQEIVEARLIPKLKELGSGPNKVAESLKALKIKGALDDAHDCPIARFIQKLFKTATLVTVDSAGVDLMFDEKDFFVVFSVAIEKFIENFDNGKYPDLVLSEVVKRAKKK